MDWEDGLIDKMGGRGRGGLGYQHDVLDVVEGHGGRSGDDAIGGVGREWKVSFSWRGVGGGNLDGGGRRGLRLSSIRLRKFGRRILCLIYLQEILTSHDE